MVEVKRLKRYIPLKKLRSQIPLKKFILCFRFIPLCCLKNLFKEGGYYADSLSSLRERNTVLGYSWVFFTS